MTEAKENSLGLGREEFTQDGAVDLKGQSCVRSKGGTLKACSFIVGYEVLERMAYYGIASSLVLYTTDRLRQGPISTSIETVTNWLCTVWIIPIVGAYIADAYLGRYWTFVIGSFIYLAGMLLLTLTVSIPGLSPPTCRPETAEVDCNKRASKFQISIFHCALNIITIGRGGSKPNISTFGADQFDDFDPKERDQKLSSFNWWIFSSFFGTLLGNTFPIYLQDNVGWNLRYALLTTGLTISVSVFLVGTSFYRHKVPSRSPFIKMARVLVASLRKWKVPVPNDARDLHELSLNEYAKAGKYSIGNTPSLRILDKAAVKISPTGPWLLCPVTQIEETKQMIKMLPILLVTCIPSMITAHSHVLFLQQGATLNRKIGSHFEIPPVYLASFIAICSLISIVIYDQFFVPTIRRYTKNPRGITLLQRMGIGLVLQIIIMVIAYITENKKHVVDVVSDESYARYESAQSTMFILLPQCALLGVADAFFEVAKIEFFYDQAPEGMKSLGASYFTSSLGVGNFLTTVLMSSLSIVSNRNFHDWWTMGSFKLSQMGYFYGFHAIASFINLVFFLIIVRAYVYNVEVTEEKEAPYCTDMFRTEDDTRLDEASNL